ncbi:MAG: haloacid dehalogenase-like hydrolase [Kiritimatiellae bacterium]|nr:haloacid dehalogenase-like hydrolase [Kiritimatiellia bacterium]
MNSPGNRRHEARNASIRRTLFFDIDGTLLHVRGAGRAAFASAVRDEFGVTDDLQWVRFAGATDLDVLRQVLERHGGTAAEERIARFFSRLAASLREHLTAAPPELCPGARELLTALARDETTLIGLITGNTGPCARIKLEAAGIHGHFVLGAFGHEHGNRAEIARLALDRAFHHGMPRDATCVVIGDTPLDIAAARAIGARALSVATGAHSEAELRAAGADHVIVDFSDTASVLAWLMSDAHTSPPRETA